MDGINTTQNQAQMGGVTTITTRTAKQGSNAGVGVSAQTQVARQSTIAMQRDDIQSSDNFGIKGQNRLNTDPIKSEKQVQELVSKLNETLTPLQPNIKFGVDQDNIFYVAAIDSKTNKVIRRFPAEEAQKVLPKMQEVTGILFDSKG
jgi:flagellar protein FlaG